MTARQIIEARLGRPLPPAAQMCPDERRAEKAEAAVREAALSELSALGQAEEAHEGQKKAKAERDAAWNNAIEAAAESVRKHAETASRKMREAHDLGAERRVVEGWSAIISHMDNEADAILALRKGGTP